MNQPTSHRTLTLPLTLTALFLSLTLSACSTPKKDRSQNNPATQPSINTTDHTRRLFAESFAEVKKGMPANQVLTLLGKPDDIRTQTDPGGISLTNTREIWSYGSDHHLGFATLGTITIDTNNQVQYLTGTKGADELVAQLGEPELRRLLRLLAETGGSILSGDRYNPLDTIAAVNALIPLGKRLGIAVLHEYLLVSFDSDWGNDDGVILVMRALFVVPQIVEATPQSQPDGTEDPYIVVHSGYFRPPAIGGPNWYPEKLTQYPLFPLVIVDDIPLLPIGGYMLAGLPEPAAQHLHYLEQSAQFRTQPLRPTDDPLSTCAKLIAMLPPEQQQQTGLPPMIAAQLLRLIDTVYRQPVNDDEEYIPPEQAIASFAIATQKVRDLKIRWEPKSNCYVRGDGSTLPPIVKPVYKRAILNPHFADDSGYSLQFTVERKNTVRIDVDYTLSELSHATTPFQLRVADLDNPQALLIDNTIKADEPGTWSSGGYLAKLPVGHHIRIELLHAGQTFVTPDIQP